MASSKPQAQIEVSISLFPEQLSLANSDQEVTLSFTAKTLSSSKPNAGIHMNAQWTVLDDRDAAINAGALFVRNTPDESIHLSLGPPFRFNPASAGYDEDHSKDEITRFVVVPALESGDTLTVTHRLTVQRLFKYARFKAVDITPGTRMKFHVSPQNSGARWWSFEDETDGKKPFEGILPDERGLRGLRADDPEAVKKRQSEGWVYSYPLRDLVWKVKDDDESAVFTFTE